MRIPGRLVIVLTLLFSPSLLADHAATTPASGITWLDAATATVRSSPEHSSTVHPHPPLIFSPPGQTPSSRRVNVPYFDGEVRFSETAIFWFGRVTPTENYADVRAGYNDNELYLYLAAFDRRLWRDTTPSPADLTAWDAATLCLNLDGNTGSVPDANAYRFVGQLNWWRPRDGYQAAYQGDGSGWVTATIPFTTTSGWRGNAINDDEDDRGWALTFRIPFTSLGLSGPPSQGTVWGLALTLHDRDDAAGAPITDQLWPEAMASDRPATWGQLAFGLPTYTAPPVTPSGMVNIRHDLNGATVVDGAVGGGSTCGSGLDFWTEWGQANYAGRGDFNIQNQSDIGDWPCFSKYYITFPLDVLPSDKVVISATLTLHQFGGAGDPGQAEPSLIQVLTVAEDWGEATLTWNNAPLAVENVAATWVDRPPFPGWPGTPFTWDVSSAVAEAYASGTPLRLTLYEADSAYHSGKYFVSADTGGWNAEGRPTLTVVWGQEPQLTKSAQAAPLPPETVLKPGGAITYALQVLGSGQALTVTDVLPAGISHPFTYTTSEGSAAYDSAGRKLTWTGIPTTGQVVTITYPVTVTQGGPYAIINTAHLTAANGSTATASAAVIVDPRQVFLPYVLKHR